MPLEGLRKLNNIPLTGLAGLRKITPIDPSVVPYFTPPISTPIDPSIVPAFGKPKVPFWKRALGFVAERVVPRKQIEFGKEVSQSLARSLAIIGAAKSELQVGGEPFKAEVTPTTELQKKIFGTDKPIGIETVGREIADITGKGETISTGMAVSIGLVFIGLDVTPFFGSKLKTSAKAISKLNKADDIIPVLKQVVKGSDDDIRALAQGLEQITDAKAIERIITKVKEVPTIAPKVAPTIPKVKVRVSRQVADEAIKFAKQNPDSSLVAKKFRNPRTKELVSGPRLFKRIGEAIRDGEISLDTLPNIVKQYGISAEQTAKLFEDAATYSGRTLQSLSRVEKELRKLLPDIEIAKRIPTGWERFKSLYLAVDNFRRALLVSQLATAMRNALSQAKRYTLGTITDAMDGVISKITGKGAGLTPFYEDIAAILRKVKPKNKLRLEEVLKNNPIESARLYSVPVGDVALSNKITNFVNTLNRGQEYFFRNLVLDAKLSAAAKSKGIEIAKLGIDDIAKGVDEALEWTYARTPTRGSFGDAIMRAYRAMPPLTLINPFPRFMSNAVKFLFDYSPAGLLKLFNPKTRAAIAAGDYNAISKAVIGTTMLGAATVIRGNENLAGEKWYEIKVGDKTIDTRPYAPFTTYLLFGELLANGGKNLSGADWATAAVSINRIAGTGLMIFDLIDEKVDAKSAKQKMEQLASSYIGGFTVPFRTLSDIIGNFRLEERTVKETRELPIIGKAVANIPGLQEILSTKYSMFEDKPLQREQSLLRQLTGITVKTKPFILKELDRMGKNIGDVIPKTGNVKANNIISKHTGILLDKFNEKLELSENYQSWGDEEKLDFLKDLISEAKSEAKGEMAGELAIIVYNEIKKSSTEDRKETIQTLKNRGLLTENILDYLLLLMEAKPLSE